MEYSSYLSEANKVLQNRVATTDADLRRIQALTLLSIAESLEELANYERQKLL